jgi:hypothetical protein
MTYKTAGTAKFAEVVQDTSICGLGCGLAFPNDRTVPNENSAEPMANVILSFPRRTAKLKQFA